MVFELALDIASMDEAPRRKRSGSSQSRPSSSRIRICQAMASLAVFMPPAGLNPT
jgi:hypothetical protein